MRQSTRGDVQWSGGTSDPRGARSRNFVRSPSGTASALVRLLGLTFALRAPHQSIQRNRVSGCPTRSDSHCLRIRVTMTHPPRPRRRNFAKGGCAAQDFCCACHVRTADRMRACRRSNGSWLLLHHGFGIEKTRRSYGRRCAATIVG